MKAGSVPTAGSAVSFESVEIAEPRQDFFAQSREEQPQFRKPVQHQKFGFDRSEKSLHKNQTNRIGANDHSGSCQPMPLVGDNYRNKFERLNEENGNSKEQEREIWC
jgi:hypothetical protein